MTRVEVVGEILKAWRTASLYDRELDRLIRQNQPGLLAGTDRLALIAAKAVLESVGTPPAERAPLTVPPEAEKYIPTPPLGANAGGANEECGWGWQPWEEVELRREVARLAGQLERANAKLLAASTYTRALEALLGFLRREIDNGRPARPAELDSLPRPRTVTEEAKLRRLDAAANHRPEPFCCDEKE